MATPLPALRAIAALILRDITSAQARGPGGYLWAVAEPVAGIALLSLVFAVSFHAPALGTSFPLFYATGLLPFLIFSDLTQKLAQTLNANRPLFAYPALSYMDALLARFALATLTQGAVAALILTGLLVFTQTRAIPDPAGLTHAFLLTVTLGFGMGSFNCLAQGLWPLWQRLWGIAMRPLFLISGVFFTFETIPHPWQDVLWWNPLIHVVGLTRAALYPGYDAAYASPLYLITLSLVLTTLALAGLSRWHRTILAG